MSGDLVPVTVKRLVGRRAVEETVMVSADSPLAPLSTRPAAVTVPRPPAVAVVTRALRESTTVIPPTFQVAVAQAREIAEALRKAGYDL